MLRLQTNHLDRQVMYKKSEALFQLLLKQNKKQNNNYDDYDNPKPE